MKFDNYRKTLFGFTGHQESGKTTIAKALKDHLVNSVDHDRADIVGFSEPLYEMVKIFGFTDEQIADKQFRNQPQECFGGGTIRQFFKTVGIDARNFYSDIWVDLMIERSYNNQAKTIICDNVRFENEHSKLSKQFNLILIGIVNSDLEPDINHPSEQHIPTLIANSDFVIDNSGYTLDPQQHVEVLMNQM